MKTKYYFLALVLTAALIRPVFAACLGNLLWDYTANPHGVTASGAALANTQLVLVKIVAVHTDPTPRSPWIETGTVYLRKIEGIGNKIPATFSVGYEKRRAGVDCETFDYFMPKPGERLLVFVRSEGKGWVIPELAASVLSPMSTKSPQPYGLKFSRFFGREYSCKRLLG